MKTPTDIDYFQSEIPIIVTTSGATGKNGLLLPELVQRYDFYMYFYIDGTLEEVSFADYVPIAKIIPDADFTLTPLITELNEYTILKIDFVNNYINLNGQYEFNLTFDHSNNAWETNLGWGAKTVWYQKYTYPCIVTGIGSNYYCEIRPGTALGTASTIVVKYQGNMVINLGTTVTFFFPKIQLGTSTDPMQGSFKIQEYTPGKLTSYIDIYTYSFVASGLTSQDSPHTYTNLASGMTLSNPVISGLTDVGLSFSCSTGVDYIIYQFPSDLSLTTSNPTVSCDGSSGVCYVFGTNANWVYYKPASTISSGTCTTTLSSFTTLYPYSAAIPVILRTVSSGASNILNRDTITSQLNPGSLTTSMSITSIDSETYINGIHIFEISFTTNYAIPAGGVIQVDIQQATISTSTPLQAIATAGLTQSTNLGITFVAANTTTFIISNFALVPSSTLVKFKIRIQLASSTSPGVKITTFYTSTLGTQSIDMGGYVSVSSPLTLTLPFFNSISVVSTRPQKQVHVTQDGVYQLSITPSVAGYTNGYLYIRYPTGFSVPNTKDDMVCRAGTIRRVCTYTSSPLVIKFKYNSADWTAGTATTVSFYTDYSPNNKKGIVAPSTAGWYQVVYEFQDSTSTIKETNMDYVFVPPADLSKIAVSAAISTAGAQNMFTVTIQTTAAVASYASGGRFYLDFPTGTGNFANDLGTALQTGDYIGCDVSGAGITAASGSTIRCRLLVAMNTGDAASVELINFDTIAASAGDIVVRLVQVCNPSAVTNTNFVITVRLNVFASNVVTYIHYSTFILPMVLLATASPTAVSVPPPAGAEPSFNGNTGATNKPLTIPIYSPVDLSIGDYFAFKLQNIQVVNPLSACPSAASQCWSFADAGMVVYKLNTAITANSISTPGDIQSKVITENIILIRLNFRH